MAAGEQHQGEMRLRVNGIMTKHLIDQDRCVVLNSHQNVSCAWTWLAGNAGGQGYGAEAKLLLLRYSFEKLKVIRSASALHWAVSYASTT